MILSRFFKARWQTTDPKARREAIQGLDSDDPALAQMAREDTDPTVRQAALARLGDIALLTERMRDDSDPNTREHAHQRYLALLAGQVPESPSLAVRLTRLEGQLPPEDLHYLLHHGQEAELRLALLKRLDDPDTLVALAAGDPSFEVQQQALARLQTPEHLELVARQSRNRSKRIYRLVQERLEVHRQAQQALTAATEVCEALEQFADDPSSRALDTRYQALMRQWEALAAPPEALQSRVWQVQQRMLARQQAASAEENQRQALRAFLDQALDRLHQKHYLDQEASDLLQQVQQRLADELPQTSATSPTPEVNALARLQARLEDRERLLRRNQERLTRLRQVLSDGERQLRGKKPVQEAGLEKLQRRWTALEQPEATELSQELQQQWQDVRQRWQQRLQTQAETRQQNLVELQQLVETLERELAEGEVKQASEHQQRLRVLFHDDQLPPGRRRDWESRVQALNKTLGELLDWRRWGTHQARDHLCEAAETLAAEETLEPPELARRIQGLRSHWQRLDRQEGAASRSAWERFNSACEKAYQPCIAYFETQAQERTENLQKREALCAELEALYADTDWESVSDWRQLDRFSHERYQRWRQLGPVDRSARKHIDKRFNAIRKRLDPLLDAQRQQDLQRRRGLISQVQALAEHPDLREAINQTKQLQAQWSPVMLGSRREEQALWKAFRGACDVIFGRREAETQAQDQERQENRQQKEALCTELETLSVAEEDLAHSRSRLQAIEQTWGEIGLVPSNVHQALERRFRQAIEHFQQRQQALVREQQQEALRSLWRRHRLCTELEQLLEQPEADHQLPIADARQAWGALPRVKATLGEAIRRRFQRICQTLESPSDAAALVAELQANLTAKQTLCLRLEILAGAETPAEFADTRMAYQVERLSASLGGGSHENLDDAESADALQEAWCLMGVLPSTQCQSLEARFQAALSVLPGS